MGKLRNTLEDLEARVEMLENQRSKDKRNLLDMLGRIEESLALNSMERLEGNYLKKVEEEARANTLEESMEDVMSERYLNSPDLAKYLMLKSNLFPLSIVSIENLTKLINEWWVKRGGASGWKMRS